MNWLDAIFVALIAAAITLAFLHALRMVEALRDGGEPR